MPGYTSTSMSVCNWRARHFVVTACRWGFRSGSSISIGLYLESMRPAFVSLVNEVLDSAPCDAHDRNSRRKLLQLLANGGSVGLIGEDVNRFVATEPESGRVCMAWKFSDSFWKGGGGGIAF